MALRFMVVSHGKLQGRASAGVKTGSMHIGNILVIKLRYIGDVLLATPVIPMLARHLPHARISFLVNEGTEDVLAHHHGLHDILRVPRGPLWTQLRFLLMLRARQYDCVVDLTDGDRSAMISAATGAPVRLGLVHARRWRRRCYTAYLEGQYGTMHMVDYHAKALEFLGIRGAPGPPQLHVPEDDRQAARRTLEALGLAGRPCVMIHPAARYWFKAWPAERFAALGDALHDKGFRIVLVGSRHEREVETAMLKCARAPFVSLIGQTSLAALAALMTQCRLFVGNDGGPMHMAAAAGCPVVALFGPSDPAVWGPHSRRAGVIYKHLDCRECFYPGCARGEQSCMNLITVEEVLREAERWLAPRGDEGGRPQGKGESVA